MSDNLINIVRKLNDELYPGDSGEHRFGEVKYVTNYWCEAVMIGDHCLWDCNDGTHYDKNDNPMSEEQIIRERLVEFCRFFGNAQIQTP